MIRVALVEDQALVREGSRPSWRSGGRSPSSRPACDGEGGAGPDPPTRPDVVLPSDMRLPKLSGLEVLQRLSASKDLPPTIILTTFDDDSTVVEGLRARRAATC